MKISHMYAFRKISAVLCAAIFTVALIITGPSAVSAEQGEDMGSAQILLLNGEQSDLPGLSTGTKYTPQRMSETAASVSISADKSTVNTSWNESEQTWVNAEDRVNLTWSADMSGGGAYVVLVSSSDDINGEVVMADPSAMGGISFGTYGLGCFKMKAIVTDSSGNPVSDYSNVIEVCSKDPTRSFRFYDVFNEPVEYTFYTNIENLAADGVVGGYDDGFFRPFYPVTRAQMAKFISKAYYAGESDTSCGAFPDVDTTNTFYTDVTTLKCKSVIGGYEDGTFKPDRYVTRGEAMKFVMNGLRTSKGDSGYLAYTGSEETFSDVATDYVFYEEIMAAYTNGVVSGYDDGTFQPGTETSRGAMSKMVDNARNK